MINLRWTSRRKLKNRIQELHTLISMNKRQVPQELRLSRSSFWTKNKKKQPKIKMGGFEAKVNSRKKWKEDKERVRMMIKLKTTRLPKRK